MPVVEGTAPAVAALIASPIPDKSDDASSNGLGCCDHIRHGVLLSDQWFTAEI